MRNLNPPQPSLLPETTRGKSLFTLREMSQRKREREGKKKKKTLEKNTDRATLWASRRTSERVAARRAVACEPMQTPQRPPLGRPSEGGWERFITHAGWG